MEYIFDLEQRVANCGFEIMEKESEARRRFERQLDEEKKAIEEECRHGIEALEQELR